MTSKFRQLMLELGAKGVTHKATPAYRPGVGMHTLSDVELGAAGASHRMTIEAERKAEAERRAGRTLTPAELGALATFAAKKGARWKAALLAMWPKSHYPGFDEIAGHLHSVRNKLGPSGLRMFKLPPPAAGYVTSTSGYWSETRGVGRDSGPPEWRGPDDHDIKPLVITASAASAARHQTLALHRQGVEAGGLKVGSKVRFRNDVLPWILGDVQGEGEGVYARGRAPGGVSLVLYSPEYGQGMSGVWLSDVRPYR